MLEFALIFFKHFADAEGRTQRAVSMVLVSDGRAKQRHDAVAEKLIHGTLIPMHFTEHQLKHFPHEGVYVFGVNLLRERGEPRNVRK